MSEPSGFERLRGHLVAGIGRDARRRRRRQRVAGAVALVTVVGGGGAAWLAVREGGGEPEFLSTRPLTSTVEEAVDDGAGVELPDWSVRAVGAGRGGVVLYGHDGELDRPATGAASIAFLLDGEILVWQGRPRHELRGATQKEPPIRVATARAIAELAAVDGERLGLLDAGVVDGESVLLVRSWVGTTMEDDETRLFLYDPVSGERRDLGFSSGWENGVLDARLVGYGLVAVLTASELQVVDLEGVRQWGLDRAIDVSAGLGVARSGDVVIEVSGKATVRDAGDGSVVGSTEPMTLIDCRGIACPVEPAASDMVEVVTVPVDGSAAQWADDAARDGAPPEIASLSYRDRVQISEEVVTPEGRWAISRTPGPGGNTPLEYGEVLLLDADGAIVQAWPMPRFPPTWLLVTDTFVYAGRNGDGALADSAVVRIDRSTREMVAVGIQVAEGSMEVPDGWLVADEAMAAAWQAAVGSPDYGSTGELVLSFNRVVVNTDWLDRYVLVADRPEPCGSWFAPERGGSIDGLIPVDLRNETACPDPEVVGITTTPSLPTPLSTVETPGGGRLGLVPSECDSETAVPTLVDSVTIWLADGTSVGTQLGGFTVPCFLGFVPPSRGS